MHIVSGELRKAPFIKTGCGQDGQSTMFAVELSEVMKDYQTGEKVYTNYRAVIFAKSPGQVDYYNSVLVEGNFIVISSEKLKVDVSDCGQYTKLSMENARLANAGYVAQSQSQGAQNNQSYAPQQGQYQQAPQQRPQQGQYQQAPQNSQQREPQQGGFNPNADQDGIPF
mgnify:CR=1 FL=1|tara:strand:+ start:1834 stop:2340 length:507 start_codon:yes stop_codon:yes gene_type:complete